MQCRLAPLLGLAKTAKLAPSSALAFILIEGHQAYCKLCVVLPQFWCYFVNRDGQPRQWKDNERTVENSRGHSLIPVKSHIGEELFARCMIVKKRAPKSLFLKEECGDAQNFK